MIEAELPSQGAILVAVSGGPDSTALLCYLKEQGRQIVAAHYDHAFRLESAADAAHVADLCRRLGVELISERRIQAVPSGSLQAAARSLRYAFLERARREADCRWVATAHTADDVVEGVLLHLLRGSGIAGLRGMPAQRGVFIRPFLNVWREEIENYLELLGEQPLSDPSNRMVERFARARVRHLLLPELERIVPEISRRIHKVAALASGWQAQLEMEAAALGSSRARLAEADKLARRQAYCWLYGITPGLERHHLEALDQLVLFGKTGDGLDLPRRRRARLLPDRLLIEPVSIFSPIPPQLSSWSCSGCSSQQAIHLRKDANAQNLHWGYRSPGLRLRLRGGTRKLQDVLVDAKVPRHLRDQLPLLFSGQRLIWVPQVAADCEVVMSCSQPGLHIQGDW